MRPTKYTDEAPEIARKYIYGGFRDYTNRGGNKTADMIPQMEGLSEVLEVCVNTLYNWGDAHPEFLRILDELMEAQRKELINNGLSGDFNSNITKLVLGKHGYHDKQDTNHTGPINIVLSEKDGKV